MSRNTGKLVALALLAPISLSTPGVSDAAVLTFDNQSDFSSALGDHLTVVDFDTDSNGAPIGHGTFLDQEYSGYGVDFNNFLDGSPRTRDLSIDPLGSISPISGDNVMQTRPSNGGGGGFEVVFDQPVSGLGMYLGDLVREGNLVALFDTSGSTISTIDVVGGVGSHPGSWVFFGVASDTTIAKMQLDFEAADHFVVDDFQFRSIPEPTTLALLVLGLTAIRRSRSDRSR